MVSAVRKLAPGDETTFSVMRGSSAMDITVTVGELPEGGHPASKRGNGYGHMVKGPKSMGKMPGLLGGAHDSLITSESRYLTDDGVKIVRKAFGAAQNIDADAGTFDLLLRGESETLSFIVSEDTKIAIDGVEGQASISDLSADATTMVMETAAPDGTRQVNLVAQGEFALTVHSILGRNEFGRMPRLGRDDSDGFSPQRFFFRWFGNRNDNGDNGSRGRGHK